MFHGSPFLAPRDGLRAGRGPAHATNAGAQRAASGPLSLNDAIQLALKNYPRIKESRARADAADAGIALAQTAYLPRLDMLWQVNRATRNNVFGLLLPQSVVPLISGPVLGTRSFDSVWGSAAGVQLSWEAVDFGQRKAHVDTVRAQSSFAKAQTALTELDIAAAAADAFVTVLAAAEVVRAAQANVDRLQVFGNAVRTLVDNQLRPGADQSRADAETAIATNQLSLAIQAADIARAVLADALGLAGTTVELAAGGLMNVPQVPALGVSDPKSHPAARAGLAAVENRPRARACPRSLVLSACEFPVGVCRSRQRRRGNRSSATASGCGT